MHYKSIEHRAEQKLSRHLPNCIACVRPLLKLLASFFSIIESEISEQASRQVATEEPKKKFCKHTRRRKLRYQNVNRDENPQRENKIESPSFKGFDAQLDCKLTHGNKNETQLTLVQYIKFSVQKQNRTKQE